MYKSHLAEHHFTVEVASWVSKFTNISCSVTQDSILGALLLLLICVDDMSQTVKKVTQNKCIRFCKVQAICYFYLNVVQNKCAAYMNEVFRQAETIRINTRNKYLKSNHPF